MANCMPFLSGNSTHFKSVNDTINGVPLSCFGDASWARSVIQKHTTLAAEKNIFISNLLSSFQPASITAQMLRRLVGDLREGDASAAEPSESISKSWNSNAGATSVPMKLYSPSELAACQHPAVTTHIG